MLHRRLLVVALVMSYACAALPVQALDIGDAIRRAKKDKEKDKNKAKDDSDKAKDREEGKADQPKAGGGNIVFGKAPLDPAKPEGLAAAFSRGDTMYGLIRLPKPWRGLLRTNRAEEKTDVAVEMLVDGDVVSASQRFLVGKAGVLDSTTLAFDIFSGSADPQDEQLGSAGLRKFAGIVKGLGPGKHTIKFQARDFNTILALGQYEFLNDEPKPVAAAQPKEETKPTETESKPAPIQQTAAAKPVAPPLKEAPKGTAGTIVFSKAPIDPAKPEGLTASFAAGDKVYSLIRMDKTWREVLGKKREDLGEIEVPLALFVDDEQTDFQYAILRKPALMDSNLLVMDMAPDLGKMTAYKDPAITYGAGKGYRKIGPDQYTYILGRLAPGKHKLRLQVLSYGDALASGEFEIQGNDYKCYAALREEILSELKKGATMPAAGMANKELEATMAKLLKNAGWSSVLKLLIVDKDWWIDRAAGGDSAIVSRHMDAAAATKGPDGKCFYKTVQFHQRKLITGEFGPLELTSQGQPHELPEENLNK